VRLGKKRNVDVTRIQILERIRTLAERYATEENDPILLGAYELLRELEEKERRQKEEALEHKGINCKECGKRFLPYTIGAYQYPFCSIGCKLGCR
jgi:hypothetical protein